MILDDLKNTKNISKKGIAVKGNYGTKEFSLFLDTDDIYMQLEQSIKV